MTDIDGAIHKGGLRSCVDCGLLGCKDGVESYPEFCLTTQLGSEERDVLLDLYADQENHNIMYNAAITETESYGRLTRVEETIDFAQRMGYRKLGIATCAGLINESRTLTKILRHHGFEVVGALCKTAAIPKTELGIPKECEKTGPTICNPVMQARYLNEQGCDLKIVMGLCVGHDSLFYKYAEGPVTTLVVKDRVLGHNPVAALYQAKTYYKRLLK